MPDREKVIKAWECCNPFNRKCKECPYEKDCYHDGISRHMVADALALLKEQEAKWVEDKQGEVCRLIRCSNCELTFIVGNNIPYDEWIEDKNYCRRCGARMVKQND